MHKFLIVEIFICSVANITLFEQIFTIDLAKSVLIVSTQVIITLTYKYFLNRLIHKKNKK